MVSVFGPLSSTHRADKPKSAPEIVRLISSPLKRLCPLADALAAKMHTRRVSTLANFVVASFYARWLAKTAILAPYSSDVIYSRLADSAVGAANSCTGQAQSLTGNQQGVGGVSALACGSRWYTGSFDGIGGFGQQLSALEVVQALLANSSAPPPAYQISINYGTSLPAPAPTPTSAPASAPPQNDPTSAPSQIAPTWIQTTFAFHPASAGAPDGHDSYTWNAPYSSMPAMPLASVAPGTSATPSVLASTTSPADSPSPASTGQVLSTTTSSSPVPPDTTFAPPQTYTSVYEATDSSVPLFTVATTPTSAVAAPNPTTPSTTTPTPTPTPTPSTGSSSVSYHLSPLSHAMMCPNFTLSLYCSLLLSLSSAIRLRLSYAWRYTHRRRVNSLLFLSCHQIASTSSTISFHRRISAFCYTLHGTATNHHFFHRRFSFDRGSPNHSHIRNNGAGAILLLRNRRRHGKSRQHRLRRRRRRAVSRRRLAVNDIRRHIAGCGNSGRHQHKRHPRRGHHQRCGCGWRRRSELGRCDTYLSHHGQCGRCDYLSRKLRERHYNLCCSKWHELCRKRGKLGGKLGGQQCQRCSHDACQRRLSMRFLSLRTPLHPIICSSGHDVTLMTRRSRLTPTTHMLVMHQSSIFYSLRPRQAFARRASVHSIPKWCTFYKCQISSIRIKSPLPFCICHARCCETLHRPTL